MRMEACGEAMRESSMCRLKRALALTLGTDRAPSCLTLARPVGALARCVLGSALLGALIDDAGQTKACVRSMCQKHVPEACARIMRQKHVPESCVRSMCQKHVPEACARSMCQKHVPEACARNICKVVRCNEIQVD